MADGAPEPMHPTAGSLTRRLTTCSPLPPRIASPARRHSRRACARHRSTMSSVRPTSSGRQPFRALIEADRLSSVILWGPPGTSKTTIAQLIARTTAKAFEQLSAVTATVKDVREASGRAEDRLGQRPGHDPVPRRGPSVQQGPAGHAAAVGRVGPARADGGDHREPLLRGQPAPVQPLDVFRLEPLGRLGQRPRATGPRRRGRRIDDDALALLVERANGDGRHVPPASRSPSRSPTSTPTPARRHRRHRRRRRAGVGRRHRGRPRHQGSATAATTTTTSSPPHQEHPGLRPDAGLYWLAHMLEAGEDARFIARRLVVLASEDIGMADRSRSWSPTRPPGPWSSSGSPRPSSNWPTPWCTWRRRRSRTGSPSPSAGSGRRAGRAAGEVPTHLRDGHYKGAKSLGHGKGYDPHDEPSGGSTSSTARRLEGRVYYEPTSHGAEDRVRQRMEQRHQVRPAAEADGVTAPGEGRRERRRRGVDRRGHRGPRRGRHGRAGAHLHAALAAGDRRRPPAGDPSGHRRAAGHRRHRQR